MSKNVQVIVPMSGIGKRFIDAGYKDPKPIIKIDNKPIIEYIYEMFNEPKNIMFICNEQHIANTNMYDEIRRFAPSATIATIERKRGPVEAVLQVLEAIDDDTEVIVSYCDYAMTWNYEEFLNEVRSANADGAIVCYTDFHPHMLGSDNYAFVKMDGNRAVKIQEKKPFTDNKMSELASSGAYYFKSGRILKKYFQMAIDNNLMTNGEFYVSEVYNLLINDGLVVVAPLIDEMLQWGTPYDLEIYNRWSDLFNYPKQSVEAKNPTNTTTIIPMAGKGSRFKEEGYDVPKPMLNLNNEPMFIKAMKCLPSSFNNVIICLKEHYSHFNIDLLLKAKFPKQYHSVIPITQVTSGQACTCQLAFTTFMDAEEPIFISSCDNGAIYDHQKYNDLVNDPTVDVIVWSFRNNPTVVPKPDMYSWLSVDSDNDQVTEVSSKNFNRGNYNPMKCHAIIGTFFFRKGEYFLNGLLANYKDKITTNGEYYVDDIINQNIKAGLNVKVFEVDHYICWGTPNDYKTYNYWLKHFCG